MKQILIRPLISEKTLTQAARGWYTFVVAIVAAKDDIAREISAFYKVTVTEVRTLHVHGKVRRVGKKMKPDAKPNWKKAMVRLKKGEKIDAFEVTGEQKEEKKE